MFSPNSKFSHQSELALKKAPSSEQHKERGEGESDRRLPELTDRLGVGWNGMGLARVNGDKFLVHYLPRHSDSSLAWVAIFGSSLTECRRCIVVMVHEGCIKCIYLSRKNYC